MKTISMIIVGLFCGLIIGAIAATFLNNFYSYLFVKSDDDSNILVLTTLSILLFSTTVGGFLGYRLCQKQSTSQETPDN